MFKCQVRDCGNPDHLKAGSAIVNAQDALYRLVLHFFDRCCRHLNHAVARLTVLQVLEVITVEGEAFQIGGLRGLLKSPRAR